MANSVSFAGSSLSTVVVTAAPLIGRSAAGKRAAGRRRTALRPVYALPARPGIPSLPPLRSATPPSLPERPDPARPRQPAPRTLFSLLYWRGFASM